MRRNHRSTINGVIHVANDKFSDAARNNNQDESDANNTITFTVDTTTPSPSPTPTPSPATAPEIEPAPENKGDIYRLIDTSTPMLRSGAENRHHCQSCLALKALTQDIERGGLQFQQTGTKSAITASYLPKDLLKEHQN